MLKDRIQKLFEGWEDQDSPFAKMRLQREPIIDKVLQIVDNAGPNVERVYELIYDFLQVSPTNNEDDWPNIEKALYGTRIEKLRDLLTHLQQSIATPSKNPMKGEGTGSADGNSGTSQSMAGSMTYESKKRK